MRAFCCGKELDMRYLRRFASPLALLAAFCLQTASARAQLADDFTTPHDYTDGNVRGTIWTGVLNAGNLVRNDTGHGCLAWFSAPNSGWEAPGFANAPTLYRTVRGDFDVSVWVGGMTETWFSDGGLIVRAPDTSLAGPGEDYLAFRYFYPMRIASVRSVDDNATTNLNDPSIRNWIRITREGDTFRFFSHSMPSAPWTQRFVVTRPDLGSLPDLQVGLWFGTFSPEPGYAKFTSFRLDAPSIPEPATLALLLPGSALAALGARRKRT